MRNHLDDEPVCSGAQADTARDRAWLVAADEQTLRVHLGRQVLAGEWTVQPKARGMVLVAHGGGDHPSARDRYLADTLHDYRLGTLLFDPLTEQEAHDARFFGDAELQARRLDEALLWMHADERAGLPVAGLFGGPARALAALVAAAQHPGHVSALVCCGGRHELDGRLLARIKVPTLLIVGGKDVEALRFSSQAVASLRCAWRLEVVPGATALFEEPGAIETLAHFAGSWFNDHLRVPTH